MNLDCTHRLLNGELDDLSPRQLLAEVLRSVIELLSIEDNDFSWSSWNGQTEAVQEVNKLLAVIEAGALPDRIKVSVLFAPTGPIQEMSLSSGWGEPFLRLAEKFDIAEKGLWL